MLDYLIIGQGLAGTCLAHQLIKDNKSFKIIDKITNSASVISSGIYNPVVLKRFTPVWNAQIEIDKLINEFTQFENLLQIPLIKRCDLFRVLANEDEVKTWSKKSLRNENLIPFLDSEIISNSNPQVKASFGLGRVKQTGRIRVNDLLSQFRNFLIAKNQLIDETLDFSLLEPKENCISYKQIEAKKIVFCDGYSLKKNPYFSYLPMEGLKGETMLIHAEKLDLTSIVKSKVFIMPTDHENYYYIGATYHYRTINDLVTTEGRDELINNLNKFIETEYKIVRQFAGIRPTVIDRRPLIGNHPKYRNMFLFNGLGSRGVMLAPKMAEELYNYMEYKVELQKEIDINRFNS
ncbi:FAD-binding oxidoreductase [Apibacter muscae]|uniref:NAD(P)/FAD-dependent oxidoreductase n=1 Tax=Apibacter muscae TaxID=2509004 RepID=UPI0011AC823E|nr:FAD-dependent oxidoreductase [Apibacter muscae]TWP28875.1 FAD-binding oxidoreductase [Apibacter muscae]